MNTIPFDLLQQLMEKAIVDYDAGRCIPNSQVDAYIEEKMGWM